MLSSKDTSPKLAVNTFTFRWKHAKQNYSPFWPLPKLKSMQLFKIYDSITLNLYWSAASWWVNVLMWADSFPCIESAAAIWDNEEKSSPKGQLIMKSQQTPHIWWLAKPKHGGEERLEASCSRQFSPSWNISPHCLSHLSLGVHVGLTVQNTQNCSDSSWR